MKTVVPPIKCQGIKTKLVPIIKSFAPPPAGGRWIEPFCGSCVVALNIRPERALLSDVNQHIIMFYRSIQNGDITPASVRAYLEDEGTKLERDGEAHYYAVRQRFNETASPFDFLFLSRACFNGVMRFNRAGKFNVPFCRKPDRFRPAHITKIANQVHAFADIVRGRDWRFEVADFRTTLAQAVAADFVYADPPYAGRHVDYYNSWNVNDESDLVAALRSLPCKFLLSTWYGNQYRTNNGFEENWQAEGFSVAIFEHFYHVGPTEDLRNAMTEALVANYDLSDADRYVRQGIKTGNTMQPTLGLEL